MKVLILSRCRVQSAQILVEQSAKSVNMQNAECRNEKSECQRSRECSLKSLECIVWCKKDSEFRLQKSECKCQTQSVDEKVTLTLSVKQSVDEKVTLTLSRRTECG